MNYWYVARPNELFLDIDNVSRSIKHAKARLQGAIECKKLDVLHVMERESKTTNHLHAIVTLANPITDIERYAWEVILHGDIYRACSNIMRSIHGIPSPDILISPWPYFEPNLEHPKFWRRYTDAICKCDGKHKKYLMEICVAAKKLRGIHCTTAFFGKPSKNPCDVWL